MSNFCGEHVFPAFEVFRSNWKRIYEDYLSIQDQCVPWGEKNLYSNQWDLFYLFDWPRGHSLSDLEESGKCQFTRSLIQEHVPTHRAAAFSRLSPKTTIRMHTGYPGDMLRFHLGLQCPEGDCAIWVKGEEQKWANGEAFVFDDRLLHRAWNLTDETRVILILDFVPPVLSWPWKELDVGLYHYLEHDEAHPVEVTVDLVPGITTPLHRVWFKDIQLPIYSGSLPVSAKFIPRCGGCVDDGHRPGLLTQPE